jgi:hypothetical protein
MDGNGEKQRRVLSSYSPLFISQLLAISATAAWMSYALYTVEPENLPSDHTVPLTVLVVTFGLLRYLYLLHINEEAETPEQLEGVKKLHLTNVWHLKLGSNFKINQSAVLQSRRRHIDLDETNSHRLESLGFSEISAPTDFHF